MRAVVNVMKSIDTIFSFFFNDDTVAKILLLNIVS